MAKAVERILSRYLIPAKDHALNEQVGDFLGKVLATAIETYPSDRSCHTCDYEQAGCCINNDYAEIPIPFRDQGCECWKDEGAPF